MKLRKSIAAILICILLFSSINVTYARLYFYDVFGHWAEDSIMWGANTSKLLNGYEDGTFKPDGNISRAEYVSLLFRTAIRQGIINTQQLVEDTLNYTDISSGFWAYDHISQIKAFIDGGNNDVEFRNIFPGNKFFPNENITREEAAILTYFLTTSPVELKDISFNDIDNSHKYFNQIISLTRNGIILGYPDQTFKPQNYITRAEAVTIIQKLYRDMEYQKKLFLGDIKLIESNSISIEYPLFGDYSNKNLSTNDLLYKKAIETLEYKSLVGIIPFEERHLYDPNPIKTIEDLRKNGYENVVGINYYLIKYGSGTYDDQTQLVEEIFASYANGAMLSDDELQIIFKKFFDLVEDMDIMLKALERWEGTSLNEVASNNALFMRSKVYLLQGNIIEAIDLYDNIDSPDIIIRMTQLMNYGYLLTALNEHVTAEKVLRDGWEQIKILDSYKMNSRKYDEQFIGALKEVLRIKQN
ncbi:MAG: S-layer homology domain-containing protein [Tissierellales bacterium]